VLLRSGLQTPPSTTLAPRSLPHSVQPPFHRDAIWHVPFHSRTSRKHQMQLRVQPMRPATIGRHGLTRRERPAMLLGSFVTSLVCIAHHQSTNPPQYSAICAHMRPNIRPNVRQNARPKPHPNTHRNIHQNTHTNTLSNRCSVSTSALPSH
jgi:hypothetical protein